MMAVEEDCRGTLRELVRASDPGTDAVDLRPEPPGGMPDRGDVPGRAGSSVARDPRGVDPEEGDLVPDPLPEADSSETADGWEASGAMEGPAPTG